MNLGNILSFCNFSRHIIISCSSLIFSDLAPQISMHITFHGKVEPMQLNNGASSHDSDTFWLNKKKRCLIFSSSNYASFFVDVLKMIWVSGSLLQTQTSRDRYYETAVVVSPPFKNEPPTNRAQPCFTTYVCSTTKRLHKPLWSEILK